MAAQQPLQPNYGSGQTVTGTGTSQTLSNLPPTKQLCITNRSGVEAYIRIQRVESGGSAVAATAADYLVPPGPGTQVSITKDDRDNTMTYLGLGASLHVMGCEGY